MSTAFAPCNNSRASPLTTYTFQGTASRIVLTSRCDLQTLTVDHKPTPNTVTRVTLNYIVSFLHYFCSQSCQTLPHIRCIRRTEFSCVWRETAAARPFGNLVVTYHRLDDTDQSRVHAHVSLTLVCSILTVLCVFWEWGVWIRLAVGLRGGWLLVLNLGSVGLVCLDTTLYGLSGQD